LADGTGFSLQRVSNSGFGNDPTNWFGATPTPGPQAASGDSDGDGLPDTWKLANGFEPFNPNDAALDPDGDGATLMLNNVQPADAGKHSVNVSHQLPWGRFGTRSSNAVLTITAPAQCGLYRLRLP